MTFVDTSSGSQIQQKTSMRWASMRGKLPITTSSTQLRDPASTVVFMSSPDASASGGTSSTFAPSHSVGFESVSGSITSPTTSGGTTESSGASLRTTQVVDTAVVSINSASIVQGQTSCARNVTATSTFSSASGHTGSPSRGTGSTSTNSQYQGTTSGEEPHTSALVAASIESDTPVLPTSNILPMTFPMTGTSRVQTLSEPSATAALSLEASSTYTELDYPTYSSGGGYPEWMPTKTSEATADQQSSLTSMSSNKPPGVWISSDTPSSTPDLSQTSKLASKSYEDPMYHETSAALATTDLSESIAILLPTPTPSISFDTISSESNMPSGSRDSSNDYEASRTAALSSDRAKSSEQTIATSSTPHLTVDTVSGISVTKIQALSASYTQGELVLSAKTASASATITTHGSSAVTGIGSEALHSTSEEWRYSTISSVSAASMRSESSGLLNSATWNLTTSFLLTAVSPETAFETSSSTSATIKSSSTSESPPDPLPSSGTIPGPEGQAITPSSSSSEGVPHNSASPAASTTVAETVASTQTMNVADDFVSPRSQESSVSTMAITSSFINDSQVAIATDSLWLNATSSTGSFFVETNSSSSATSSSTFPASETVSATELSSSESPLSTSIGQSVSSASSDDSYTEDSVSTHYKPASVSASPTVRYDAIALATTSSSTTSDVSLGTSVDGSSYTDSMNPETSASSDTDIGPSQNESPTIADVPYPTMTGFKDTDNSVTPLPDSSSDISSIDDRQTPIAASSSAEEPSSSSVSLPEVTETSSSDSSSFETSPTFTGTTEPYPSATAGAVDTDEHFVDVVAGETTSSSSTVEPSATSLTGKMTNQTGSESILQSPSSVHHSSEAKSTIAEMDTGSMPPAATSSATFPDDANYATPSSSEVRVETATIPSSSTSPTDLDPAQTSSSSLTERTSTFHAPSNTTYTSLEMETNSVSAAPSSSATISSSSIPEPLPTASSPSPSDDLGWTETSTTSDPYSSDVVAQDLSSSSISFSESLSTIQTETSQRVVTQYYSNSTVTTTTCIPASNSGNNFRKRDVPATLAAQTTHHWKRDDAGEANTASATCSVAPSVLSGYSCDDVSSACSCYGISSISQTPTSTATVTSGIQQTDAIVQTTTESITVTVISSSTSYIPQTSTVLYCPRPSSDCNNKGYLFAYYGNEPYGNDVANMDATYTKQMTPTYNSTTNQGVGIYGSEWSSVSLYGSSQMYSDNYFYLSHKGYFFAQVTGYYNFTIKDADDIAYVWMGDAAYSGWTGGPSGGNYVAKARCCWPPENTNTTTYWMEAETYVPFRIVLGQQDGSTSLGLTITAPDGTVILQTGKESDYVVQYSCDGTAPPFPDWGYET
ncbi:hypothetical protein D6C97_03248 [Aureobasidium pullulans]|nr:hypothetical protein D6C97_03248 [Aureobasidium pullulans]